MSQEIISMMRNTTPGYHPGWGGPEYTSWQDEQMSWKRTCYIGDWSFLMDVEVTGEDALKFFQDTGINGFASLTALFMAYFGARFGVLGVYVTGRTREKQASASGELPPTLLGELLKIVTNKKK